MNRLIDAFDSYNDFERYSYFAVCYDALASSLSLEIPLKDNRENMQRVMDSIEMETHDLSVVFRYWNTEDSKEADSSKDFPYKCLLKSEKKPLLIWVVLDEEELYLDLMYDVSDAELETWALHVHQEVRKTFGESKNPTFKVLSYEKDKFSTQEVRISNHEQLNIDRFYNDDFLEIDKIIKASMNSQKSGLILLYGDPGTGKTSYIKNLISQFEDKSFIFIQNEFVKDLLKPQFVSFLLNHKNAVLIIEDAEKVIKAREYKNEDSVVSTLLQLTDGLFSDYLNLKVICTFNSKIEQIDKALFRKGRMIATYKFGPLSKEKIQALCHEMKWTMVDKAMTLAEVFNLGARQFSEEKGQGSIGFKSGGS